MSRHSLFSTLVVFLSLGLALQANSLKAAPPADQLLPNTTRGFVSVTNLDDLVKRFNLTQIGQLVNDPIIQPFAEDLKRQLGDRLNRTEVRLGIRWKDLQEIRSEGRRVGKEGRARWTAER